MGSFSIWHWIVLGVIAAGIYGIYRLANREGRAETSKDGKPIGVGGWLLLLVVGLIVLGPIFGAGRMNLDLSMAEYQHPSLTSNVQWNDYKTVVWWTFAAISGLSIFAGINLIRRRDESVVKQTKIVLWTIGPIANLVLGGLVPLIIFGDVEGGELIAPMIVSAITAAIWTAYLSKSRRVIATYRLTDHSRQSIPSRAAIADSFSMVSDVNPTVYPTRRPAEASSGNEDAIYEAIAAELDSGDLDKGLWARATAEKDGHPEATKARYIQLRFAKLSKKGVKP